MAAALATPLLDRDAEPSLIEQIADRLADQIGGGALAAGDRLPSVRRARALFGVSTGTVLEAYHRLEGRGLVEARPRSGYYVRAAPARSLAAPRPARTPRRPYRIDAPLSLRLLADAGSPDTVRLGAAVPDPGLFPLAALNRLHARALRDDPEGAHTYHLPAGDPGLRKELARRMFEAGCSGQQAGELLVTNGASEAVQLALGAVTRPGDVVAVEWPTYHGLLETLRSLHLRALPVATSARSGIELEDLARALTKRRVAACALVTGFSNPLGATMTDAKKSALVSLLAEHDVPLVEDDVYGDLPFDGRRPAPVKAFDPERVLYCSSFSKTLTAGWRIGWCAPGRWRDDVERLKLALNYCTAAAPQRAIADFLRAGAHDRHLRRLRQTFRDNVDRTVAQVAAHFPEGSRTCPPRGGHVLWVELPAGVDSLALYEQAIAEGISIAPGPLFGRPDAFTSCLRLNCGIPWTPRVALAVERVGALAKRQLEG